MLRARWIAGAVERGEGPVLASLTDFRLHSAADLPRAAWTGWRLSRLWPGLDGAIGVWLWADLPARRIGSVSVWRHEGDLKAFVALPAHVQIMRAYRGRGTLTSTSWTSAESDPWAEAAGRM